jgi:hypothetical protein
LLSIHSPCLLLLILCWRTLAREELTQNRRTRGINDSEFLYKFCHKLPESMDQPAPQLEYRQANQVQQMRQHFLHHRLTNRPRRSGMTRPLWQQPERDAGIILSTEAGDGIIISTVSIFETRTEASREANGRPCLGPNGRNTGGDVYSRPYSWQRQPRRGRQRKS